MSFYSDASLAMIPSGYKDQKVYSALPITGDGDLTFSRASSATRVAANGYIEKVRTNLVLQSQDFTTTWTPDTGGGTGSVNVTANYGVAPDGTTTADRIELTRGTLYANIYQNISTTAGQEYTASVYLKSLSGTPTVSFLYDSIAYSTTLTSGWVRVSATYTASGSTTAPLLGLFGGDSATADFLAWGYQLEAGVMTDYIPTTSAAVSVGPVSGLPRLDYLDSSAPRLLLEPQRTNVLQFSEQFDNAYWTKTGATITANTTATLDPSGYNGADKLVEDSSTGSHVIFTSVAGTSGTFSFFAKAAERSWVSVLANNGNRVYFNLSNGTLGTVAATSTASITSYGNGWYRCVVFNTHGTFGASVYLATDNDVATYTGDGTSGAYIFGAQFEASATYATSYIPTLGTSVTRVADAASKTGISSLIGQTEGAFMIDVNLDARASFTYFALAPNLALATNYLGIGINAGSIVFECVESSVLQAGIVLNNFATGRFKIAAAYKANDFVMYVNGTQVGTDTSGSVPACSQIGLYEYSQTPSVKYNQVLVFQTRLSNSDLATLTTL